MRVVGVAPFSQSRHERDRQPPFHRKRSDRQPDVRRMCLGFLIAGLEVLRHCIASRRTPVFHTSFIPRSWEDSEERE